MSDVIQSAFTDFAEVRNYELVLGKKSTKCEEIEVNQKSIYIAKDFCRQVKYQFKMLGMSMNQTQFNERICIVRDISVNSEEPKWITAINPRISGVEGESYLSEEDCLTWPGKLILAYRYPKIQVTWYDADEEKEKTEEFAGFQAKIWAHEIQHLDGEQENVVEKDWKSVKNPDKIGRNEPCSCGSGKKYKKCCGR